MKGIKINTLEELCDLALKRKSVVSDLRCFTGPIPAAFVQNLQARIVFKMLKAGMWIYEKESK